MTEIGILCSIVGKEEKLLLDELRSRGSVFIVTPSLSC
jgi:hypothetical protein